MFELRSLTVVEEKAIDSPPVRGLEELDLITN